MNSSLKILLIEDNEADAELLIRHLKREGINFTHQRVWDKEGFVRELQRHDQDLIIADYSLPQFNGVEAFRLLKRMNKNIPFIIVTGSISEKLVIECTKDGIDDYLMKDNLLRLSRAMENVLNKRRVERLHSELVELHAELKSSINYARMIQSAILPESGLLKEVFAKSFIYFHPKDSLSGDFYWFKNMGTHFYVAVADCTGHGIPGGLLSMMGFNMLYEVLAGKRITLPSEVLNKLDKKFKRITNNSGSKMRDGMDIAFCTIDLLNKTLTYAGANRPLFIIRQNELLEFKPDKIAIDGLKVQASDYTDHKVNMNKGDRVFMFSDGFIDQFHHKTDKKLLMKRFKDQLIATARLDFDRQKKSVIDFFEEWKGNADQTDDVILLGFEIE